MEKNRNEKPIGTMQATSRTYQVGGLRFRVTDRCGLQVEELLPAFRPFAVEEMCGEELFCLTLSDGTEPAQEAATEAPVTFEWEEAQCTILPLTGDRHRVSITPIGSDECFTLCCEARFRRCVAFMGSHRKSPFTGFVLNNFLMMLYAFRAAAHDALLMHASVIAHQGRGYLFLGKSGTGKSTHTRLWLTHIPDCHLLNDDNPIVRLNEDGATATVYGSPWSGKTPCYRNEQLPVGAFVRLEQAPANEICRLGSVHAFAALLPSCSCLKQERAIYADIVRSVTALAARCPVYHLKCLPDAEAAQVCHAQIVRP